jgi:hypothetical protein
MDYIIISGIITGIAAYGLLSIFLTTFKAEMYYQKIAIWLTSFVVLYLTIDDKKVFALTTLLFPVPLTLLEISWAILFSLGFTMLARKLINIFKNFKYFIFGLYALFGFVLLPVILSRVFETILLAIQNIDDLAEDSFRPSELGAVLGFTTFILIAMLYVKPKKSNKNHQSESKGEDGEGIADSII